MASTITGIKEFDEYIAAKIAKNGGGGRPHIVAVLAKTRDPADAVLDILEAVWIKDRTIGNVAPQFGTGYLTISRLIDDMAPLKEKIIAQLKTIPRAKRFYYEDSDTSDFDLVQNYIRRAHRDGLMRYKQMIRSAERCYKFLGYRDPATWTSEDVLKFLNSLSEGAQSGALDGIRQICPQIVKKGGDDQIGVRRFRNKLTRRKKDIFGKEFLMIRAALEKRGMDNDLTIHELHVALGAREGSKGVDPRSGLSGLTWNRFKDGFRFVDVFESKVHGGIWWRDCPTYLLFRDLPKRLNEMWIARGKPTTDKLISYEEIGNLYKRIRAVLKEEYDGHVDPALLNEFQTIRAHDADKIHVNLLWEAGVPLEVVAGEYIGQNEGVGLVGRGWLCIDIIKKHYLSLTRRSARFTEITNKIAAYAVQFNEGDAAAPTTSPNAQTPETFIAPTTESGSTDYSHDGGFRTH